MEPDFCYFHCHNTSRQLTADLLVRANRQTFSRKKKAIVLFVLASRVSLDMIKDANGIAYRQEQCYKLVYLTLKKSITLPTCRHTPKRRTFPYEKITK